MSKILCVLIIIAAAAVGAVASGAGRAAEAGQTPEVCEVTVKGNVVCHRATMPTPWDGTTQDRDHLPVVFAFEGTPEITAAVADLMDKCWPPQGLDVEAAQKLNDEWGRRLAYRVAPGPLTDEIHEEVEWGSQLLALTGVVYEQEGRKWIAVSKYEPTSIQYPAEMLAPDKPLVMPDEQPIVLGVSETVTLRCMAVPAGRFLQGSPFYQQRYQDEFPHEVVLTKPFHMSETPVTQEMFKAVVGKNPSDNVGPQFPVERAIWPDIVEFCRVLSDRNGRTVRLPTDAEWEYAARVGTSSPCFTEKYADQMSAAGTKENLQPVKTMRPNAWGLYDMLCGGWHITADYKADNVRTKQTDQKGPALGDESIQMGSTGPMHKARGGYHYNFIRPNMHGAAGEDGSLWEGGVPVFRIVVEATPPAKASPGVPVGVEDP
ncbi:MAG: formylglycine-generating enzyme family protein [Planctomycetota bacterium]|jgi:formylglycine-generating enzyme required for sulfatase activity